MLTIPGNSKRAKSRNRWQMSDKKKITLAVVALLAIVGIAGCSGTANVYPDRQSEPHFADKGIAAPAYYYFTTAQLKAKQGDINEAVWLLEQALAKDPKSPSLQLEMARLLIIRKETDRALRIVKKILAAHPDHKQALTMAGQIFLRMKNDNEARQVFEKLVKNKDAEPSIYLQLGRFLLGQERPGQRSPGFRENGPGFP